MRFIADFHIHSHYSIATSKKLVPEYLEYYARMKGISVLGTGDCIHPGWSAELKEKLEPAGNGLFRLKPSYTLHDNSLPDLAAHLKKDVFFLLTAEISSIYKKDGKVRKVHNLCVFPDFESLEKLQSALARVGNIASDGRPILGLDSKYLLEMLLETSEKSFLIPAHIWTPWFSVLGSKSGFDTIEACYEDLTGHIFAVETGLSSDPPMNWACSFLDRFQLVSNSDAHSPEKLGREANLFDTDISYNAIYDALKTGHGFDGTVEFFPQEGKYHYDGHRKCGICWDPLETIRHKAICTVCGKPVTRGVMYRVAELADRPVDAIASQKKKFYSITSLPDLVAEVLGKKTTSKVVAREYFKTVNALGSDFDILLFTDLEQIQHKSGELFAEGIRRLRSGQVHIQEGYDGEFGRITVFAPGEIHQFAAHAPLFDIRAERQTTPVKEGSTAHQSLKFDIDQFKQAQHPDNSSSADTAVATSQPTSQNIHNDDQQAGIEHGEGPCMVLAGPGTGKTRVLTERIAYLIKKQNVAPESILAVTFSNKAAQEMRERLQIIVPDNNVTVKTFHALGVSILTDHCERFGRSYPFAIFGNDEIEPMIQEGRIAGSKAESKKILAHIDAVKQGIDTNDEFPAMIDRYDDLLRSKNAFDLNDLIYLPVCLLRDDRSLRERIGRQYQWILIDEYQDINARQYEMIRYIAGDGNPNLFVIGDPNQAIYRFRGSDVRFIDRLRDDYPQVRQIFLSTSYRCPSPVLQGAGQALGVDAILSGRPDPIKIRIVEAPTDTSEADMIAARIEAMMGGVRSFSFDSGMSDGSQYAGISGFGDFAVLCRTAALFDPFITAFNNHGIPYQIINTEPFYRKEPLRTFLAQLRDRYMESAVSKRDNDILRLSSSQNEIIGLFTDNQPLDAIIESAIIGKNISADDRKRLVSLAAQFGSDYTGFFHALVTRQGIDDYDPRSQAVSLMTIHASKGLEFTAVFIPACEQGIIPFELFGKKQGDDLLEEERLFYVGVTRTKQYLYLSHARKRHIRGRTLTSCRSYLLDRIDRQLLEMEQREAKLNAASQQLSLFEL